MQPTVKVNRGENSPLLYRLLYRIIWMFSPKYTLYGTEKLPDEPCGLLIYYIIINFYFLFSPSSNIKSNIQ